ncbi:MAG: AbrB/MazE/SpoVT family DNA-binding domain-containing protein [bacterium]
MAEITKMSSRGQIVVPSQIREKLHLTVGDTFAVYNTEDAIVLKKIQVPSAEEAFEKLNQWGVRLAKERGWKEKDVVKIVHRSRNKK